MVIAVEINMNWIFLWLLRNVLIKLCDELYNILLNNLFWKVLHDWWYCIIRIIANCTRLRLLRVCRDNLITFLGHWLDVWGTRLGHYVWGTWGTRCTGALRMGHYIFKYGALHMEIWGTRGTTKNWRGTILGHFGHCYELPGNISSNKKVLQ